MMNDFLSIGLGRYRKFGMPYQFPVRNQREIVAAIEKHNGINDCFISISEYQQIDNREIVFPLYFPCDLDAQDKNQKIVNEDATKITRWCFEHQISFLLHESGYKGLHILIPLDLSIVLTSQHFKAFLEYLISELNLKTIDPVCAETKRLIRIPNTINMKSGQLCTSLGIHEANDLDINDFIKNNLKPFECAFGSSINQIGSKVRCMEPFFSFHPGIDKLICDADVAHVVRVTWVKLCQMHGMTEKEIFNRASMMGWSDFDPAKTAYQIRYTMNQMFSISCKMEYCIDECPFRRHIKNI
jgi:hypothetical protein